MSLFPRGGRRSIAHDDHESPRHRRCLGIPGYSFVSLSYIVHFRSIVPKLMGLSRGCFPSLPRSQFLRRCSCVTVGRKILARFSRIFAGISAELSIRINLRLMAEKNRMRASRRRVGGGDGKVNPIPLSRGRVYLSLPLSPMIFLSFFFVDFFIVLPSSLLLLQARFH